MPQDVISAKGIPIPFSEVDWKNKEQVLQMVRFEGLFLQYADESLKADKEVAMEAMNNDDFACRYVHDSLYSNRDFFEELLKNSHVETIKIALDYASKEIQADKELATLAMSRSHELYSYFKELKYDKELALAKLEHQPSAYKYLPDELKRDRDIVNSALKNPTDVYKYLPEEYQYDKNIALKAISNVSPLGDNPEILFHKLPLSLRFDKDIALELMKIEPMVYKELPVVLKMDKDVEASLTSVSPENKNRMLPQSVEYKAPTWTYEDIIKEKEEKGLGETLYNEQFLKDVLQDNTPAFLSIIRRDDEITISKAYEILSDAMFEMNDVVLAKEQWKMVLDNVPDIIPGWSHELGQQIEFGEMSKQDIKSPDIIEPINPIENHKDSTPISTPDSIDKQNRDFLFSQEAQDFIRSELFPSATEQWQVDLISEKIAETLDGMNSKRNERSFFQGDWTIQNISELQRFQRVPDFFPIIGEKCQQEMARQMNEHSQSFNDSQGWDERER